MRSATNPSAEQEDPSVLHRDAPSSVEGRHRLVPRCRTRPIATGLPRITARRPGHMVHLDVEKVA